MALYYDLPVYQEVYRLILLVFEYVRDFPRDYTFSLGQDTKRDGLALVRSNWWSKRTTMPARDEMATCRTHFRLLELMGRRRREKMRIVTKVTLMAVLLSAGLGSVSVYADDDDVVYRFPYAYGVHEDGRTVAIVGPVIEMDEDDYHVGMENQWNEWLEAYAEEFSGIPSYEYRDGSLGPKSSRSEAEGRRRDFLGDAKRDNDEVFETSRVDVPEFRYYPD